MKRILFLVMFISLVYCCLAGADVSDKNAQLIKAAEDGRLPAVQTALAAGADVNAKDSDGGITALYMAAQEGHVEVVKLLLEKGADVNVKTTDAGITAMWIAAGRGHKEIVKCLLDFKADVNVKASINGKDYTALGIAKERGQTDIVQFLEKVGAKE